MLSLSYVVVVAVLTCLSGVGAFALLWPRDANKPRPFRTWPLTLLVLGIAAPAIIAVPIFRAEFLTDNGIAWLEWALYGACAATLALVALALVGDRARGRRRCPRCWYDMAGTPGVTCPECGRVARGEGALLRSRRRPVLFAAAFIPAVAAVVPWAAMYFRGPDWAKNLPNTAFVLAYPFAHHHRTLANEVEDSLPTIGGPHTRRFSEWQRALLVRFARKGQGDAAQPFRMMIGCATLIAFGADDRTTVDALTSLASTSQMYSTPAIKLLGQVHTDLPRVKATLLGMMTGPDLTAAYLSSYAIAGVLPRAPGGPAPAEFFSENLAGKAYSRDQVANILRFFDPCEESRALLIGSLESPKTRRVAIVSLVMLWPRDAGYRDMLLEAIRFHPDHEADSDARQTVYMLLFDERLRFERLGRFEPERLALYTPELCDELAKWLPAIEAHESTWTPPSRRATTPLLRRLLDEARRAHGQVP